MTKHELTFISLLISLCILVFVAIILMNMVKLQNIALNRFVLENCNIQKQEVVTTYQRR